MKHDPSVPDPAVVLDLIEAFRRSKTMFAAVSLGLFDCLAGGPESAEVLAHKFQLNQGALAQLLDGCVGLGLLTKEGTEYKNTPVAATFLCRSSPRQLTGYIQYSNAFLWKLWANLEDAIREGTNRWRQTFHWEGPIFDNFFKSEDAKKEFLMGMHGFGMLSSPKVVAAFDLSRFKKLVDLGGATGHLAQAAKERYPKLEVTVFDLPAVAELFEGVITGDFFSDPLPPADLYALG